MNDPAAWPDSFLERIAAVEVEVGELVGELRHADRQWMAMDQLPKLGTMALPSLRQLRDDKSEDSNVRASAALVMLRLNDVEGSAPLLIEQVRAGAAYSPTIARALAAAGVEEVLPEILIRLRAPEDDEFVVVAFLDALHILGKPLPSDIRIHLQSSPSTYVSVALADWFGS